MKCPFCGEECTPYLSEDMSFTHFFGIHRPQRYWLCDMCDSELPDFEPDEGYLEDR